MLSLDEFNYQMNKNGYVILPEVVPHDLVNRMIDGIERSYIHCREIQIKNGIDNSENTVHHLVGQASSFMDFLCLFEDFNHYAESYFGGKYILNSFGGNLLKSGSSYASNIHRDIRSFSDNIPLLLNIIITLDDFTQNNGATWLMVGGHKWEKIPTKEQFERQSFQAIAPAGSIVMFNSNMWHCAGENKTNKPRRSITPMFSRPFIKSQFDYPRALGYENGNKYSPWMKQVLGYNSRIPETLEQWYKPKEQRMYRGDQG